MQELIGHFGVSVLLETGTYGGTTARMASPYFREIHTVELHHGLFLKGKANLSAYPNVYCYEGTSPDFISEVAPEAQGRILYWLDAHWCGADTAADGQNTPILRELDAIRRSGVKDSVILIDDIRCFHGLPEGFPEFGGYPTVSRLKEAILAIDGSYRFCILGDMALAFPENGQTEWTDLVEACTVSRLMDPNQFDPSLLCADRTIRSAYDSEEAKIIETLQTYISSRVDCTGYYFLFWKGLLELGRKHYNDAAIAFRKAADAGFQNWRVFWYLAEAEEGRGNRAEARRLLGMVLDLAPEFQEARSKWEAL